MFDKLRNKGIIDNNDKWIVDATTKQVSADNQR